MDEEIYRQLGAMEDRHWWFRGRRAVIRSLLAAAELPAPARVLDAGCGTGRNLREFAALGEIVGAEPSASAVAYCRAHGLANVVEAPVERLPFADAHFDLVLALDVLEHTDDDGPALREIRRVTRSGGLLLATVPAYMWLWSQHDDSHHHRRRYTRRRLAEAVRRAGWTPVRATYFNSLLLPPIAVVRTLARRRRRAARTDYELTSPALNRLLEQPMRAEAALIRRGLTLPAGVSVGLLARA